MEPNTQTNRSKPQTPPSGADAACCSPQEKTTCCEPSAKSACCGEPKEQGPSGCGCR